VKGIEDFLEGDHLLGLFVDGFPHDAIRALAELL
jgi:hypothetical protein